MSNNSVTFGVIFTADGKVASAETDRLRQSTEAYTKALKDATAGLENGKQIEQNLIALRNEHIQKINQQASALQALKGHTAELIRNYQETGSVSGKAFDDAATGANKSAFATAGAKRELMVLGHEAMTGNFSRMPGSFLVLAERMSMTTALFNPMTLGAIGLGAAAVGVAVAIHKGHEEMVAMDNALLVTNNYAGLTRGGMESLATSMASSGQITIGTSKEIVTALVSSGRIGSEAIRTVARLTSDFARATGGDIDKIAPEMIKLFSDPLRGAEELNKQMHFLTVADIEHIATLTRLGEVQEAQLFLAEKVTEHMPKEEKNVGTLIRAYRLLAGTVSEVVDSLKKIGAETSIEAQLKNKQGEIAALEKYGAPQSVIENRKKEAMALMDVYVAQQKVNSAKANEAAASENQLNAQRLIKQSTTYRIFALEQERRNIVANGLVDEENGLRAIDKNRKIYEIDKEIESLRRSIGAEGRQRTQEEIAYQTKLSEITLKTGADEIETQYKLGKITVQQRDELLLDNQLEVNFVKQLYEEQMANVKGLTAAEKQRHVDKLNELQAEGAAAAKAGINKGLVDEKKFYDDIRKAVDALGNTEIGALDKAISAQRLHNAEIGKTADQIALAKQEAEDFGTTQLEVEADALRAAAATVVMSQEYKDIYTARANALDIEIAKRKQLAGLLGEASVLEANAAATKKITEDWNHLTDDVSRSLADAIMNGGHHGADLLKRYFSTLVLTPTINAIMAPFTNAIGGALGANVAGPAGGGLIGGGLSGLYGSFAGSGFGQAVGLSAPVEGVAGGVIGTEMTALGTALPYVAAGLVIANALGLFGKGGGPQQGQYGTVGAKGYTPEFTYSGGDTLGNQALAQSAYNQVAALYLAAGKSITDLAINQGGKLDPQGTAAALGYRQISVGGQTIGSAGWDNPAFQGAHDDAKGLATYLGKLTSAEIEQIAAAIDDPKLSDAIGKLKANFGDLADAMPAYLTAQAAQKGLLESLKTETEKLADAHQVLATVGIPETVDGLKALVSGLDLTNQADQDRLSAIIGVKGAFDLVQQSLTATGETAVDTARSLADIASERKSLQDQYDSLTMSSTELLAKQRAGIDASNQALFDQVQNILAANAATEQATQDAKELKAAQDQLAATNRGWQDQLDVLTGKETARSLALRDATDGSTQAIMRQVYAMQDQKAAADAAAAALLKAQQDQQKIYDTALSDVTRAQGNLLNAYQREVDVKKQLISTWHEYATSLLSFKQSLLLGDLSPLSPQQKYAQSLASFQDVSTRAKLGDETAVKALQGVAQEYLTASRAYNASSDQYSADFAAVQSALTLTAGVADRQANIAQLELNALTDQVSALITINNSVLGVGDAITALAAAMSVLNATPAATPAGNVPIGQWVENGQGTKYYRSGAGAAAVMNADGSTVLHGINGLSMGGVEVHAALMAAADAGNAQAIYDAAKAWGVSLSDINKIGGAPANTAEDWARAHGLPVFHSGIDPVPATGFALLERGERVISARNNSGSNVDVAAKIDALIAEFGRLRKEQQRQAEEQIKASREGTQGVVVELGKNTAAVETAAKESRDKLEHLIEIAA